MAAFFEVAAGDSLVIGKSIIKVERKSGQKVRLAVDSSEDIEHIKAGERASHGADSDEPAPYLRRP